MGVYILIASELQHLIWNAYDANSGAMVKIDLRKAFDKMSWAFIRGALVWALLGQTGLWQL